VEAVDQQHLEAVKVVLEMVDRLSKALEAQVAHLVVVMVEVVEGRPRSRLELALVSFAVEAVEVHPQAHASNLSEEVVEALRHVQVVEVGRRALACLRMAVGLRICRVIVGSALPRPKASSVVVAEVVGQVWHCCLLYFWWEETAQQVHVQTSRHPQEAAAL